MRGGEAASARSMAGQLYRARHDGSKMKGRKNNGHRRNFEAAGPTR